MKTYVTHREIPLLDPDFDAINAQERLYFATVQKEALKQMAHF